jgi:hypothetical protein
MSFFCVIWYRLSAGGSRAGSLNKLFEGGGLTMRAVTLNNAITVLPAMPLLLDVQNTAWIL